MEIIKVEEEVEKTQKKTMKTKPLEAPVRMEIEEMIRL